MRVEYIILLLMLLGLEWVGAGISSSSSSSSSSGDGAGDGNNDNTTHSMMSSSSTALFNIITDDPPHRHGHRHHHRPEGGLHWRDLGVSLANCPWTTAQMLDKYNSDPSLDSTTSMDDGRKRQWQCMDDSAWLLHPSSGFVENGSLCGILGPR